MPIQQIVDRKAPPIIGTIRLGTKVKTDKGFERPDNAAHFVLHDAQQVIPVYGETPQALDVIFPSDNLEEVVPSWLKLWGQGAKDAKGKVLSGKLRCRGNGPSPDGVPGVANWYEKMDPKTGVTPTRDCLGEKCPDWLDAKGNPACKPNMQIFVYLPKVSPFGVFKISTTSWTAIKSFYDQLQWIQNLNQGRIRGIPFKLVKEQKAFKVLDPHTGQMKDRPQWVVLLRPNEDKAQIEEMRQQINLLEASTLTWQAPAELLEAPAEDVPYLEAETGKSEAATKVATAEDLAKDPEILAGFEAMEAAMGSKLSAKDRLILIRKKEKEPDVKKALLEGFQKSLASFAAKAKPAMAEGGLI